MSDSETDLIRLAQSKDTGAFCLLAEQYTRRIYLLAYHYCRNAQDAEDLSQEVWLKAFQALGSFRFESSFYTWLRRITINTFLNRQRSGVAHMLFDSVTATEEADCHSISEEPIYNRLLFESVLSALGELTPSQRLMFLLRHYEGMTYDEIASEMNCSSGTVKKSVWRALGKLRAKLVVVQSKSDEGLALALTTE